MAEKILNSETTDIFTTPFSNSFDWRFKLFRVLSNLPTETLREIIKKCEEIYSIEWNNDEDIFLFAAKENLLIKMAAIVNDNRKIQYDLLD